MEQKESNKSRKKEAIPKRVNIIKTMIVKQGSILTNERELNTPLKVAEFARHFYGEGADREYVWICTFDNKCHPLSIEMVSMGTINQALISPREIFKSAILSCAASIILFHNHISGNPEPSKEDIHATRRIKESGDILGIPLLDHIILGEEEQFVSLRERKLLDTKECSSYVTD